MKKKLNFSKQELKFFNNDRPKDGGTNIKFQ